MSKKKIVIIEDDQDIRESLSLFLESEGYPVQVAENGKEGLVLLRSLCAENDLPGLVFLDLQMPVMSGDELLMELMRDPKLSSLGIPIVVFTAAARGPIAGPILEAMKKPVDLDIILQVVSKYCGDVDAHQ